MIDDEFLSEMERACSACEHALRLVAGIGPSLG